MHPESDADVVPVRSVTLTRHVLDRKPEVSMRKLPEPSALRVMLDSPAVGDATVTGELAAARPSMRSVPLRSSARETVGAAIADGASTSSSARASGTAILGTTTSVGRVPP